MKSALTHFQIILVELVLISGISFVYFMAMLFHPTAFWIIAGILNAVHFILAIRYSRTHFKLLVIAGCLVPLVYLVYPFYLEISTSIPGYTFVPVIYYFLGVALLVVHLILNRRWQKS